MSESTFTPLKEEPENANVKEEPDDPYISFDEVPLHMEVECDPMDLHSNEDFVQNDEPLEETRAERRRRMNRESRERRRAKMRAEKGNLELPANHTMTKENSNARPEQTDYCSTTKENFGGENQSCDQVPMFLEGNFIEGCADESTMFETAEERRKRRNRERTAKSRAKKKAEDPEKVREADRIRKRLLRQKLKLENPEKLEQVKEIERLRYHKNRRKQMLFNQTNVDKAGEGAMIVKEILEDILAEITPYEGATPLTDTLGYIKEECIYEDTMLESPDEKRKRLSRERAAKRRAKMLAENPEEFREKERKSKYLRRKLKMAENPEKVREAERMRSRIWRLNHDIEKIREKDRNRKRLQRLKKMAEDSEDAKEWESAYL